MIDLGNRNPKRVVMIQALFRGHRCRTMINDKPMLSNRSKNRLASGPNMANKGRIIPNKEELAEMPDFSNEQTRATEEELGAYVF